MAKLTAEQRFWPKVNKDGPVPDYAPHLGPCWIWTKSRNDAGYGKFSMGSGWVGAHRFAYQLLVGPIPADRPELDHLCRVTCCVNPEHLEPVTTAENLRRAALAITHCPSGHLFEEASTWVSPTGHRQCRICDRDRHRAARGGWQGRVYGGSHCAAGHEWTAENTCITKSGKRRCRACAREYTRRHRAKAGAAD